ncbi:protein NRT1/ PTR FAMILY 2.6-like isoform X1 [Rhododendron vialii]|uniref:protein NRT1/ PTR FAMILY 2.6-like isoform X1 n=1 Tax=Rhododendron vialii TaxID=182163 RepID=UPI00265EDA86|nr:protein NRT1/ PTR FAMILY 2.6-like isoform X1 [Rhododendron vialii]
MGVEEGSSPCDGEAQAAQLRSQAFDRKQQQRGGWITFPFIAATMAGLTLAAGGWINNFIVFMIGEFNVKSIDAAQLWNVVNGCTSMFPVVGAIVADSFLGNFSVICISSLFSLLGIILLLLCSTIDSLRPPPCDQNGPNSCITASRLQLSILYLAITLATIGVGGTRFTIGALGADQFDDPRHQGSFFNWYLFTLYTSSAISATAVVYVEDNVSWGWGFGICAASNVVGLAIFASGGRFYRPVKPKGSPFTGLARVVVAAVRKRNVVVSSKSEDYYDRADNGGVNLVAATPTGAFKFLNRAALLTEGDTKPDGSIAKLWKLCTLQQVEDLKTLIRISPLWSTGILLSTPLAVQMSLATLQAITMNRHIGPHFKIPAGSMLVFIMVSCCIALIFIERFFFPMWQKVAGRFPPPLQRIGIGHVLCALSMAVSAIVESKRLEKAHNIGANSIVPMSVLWLVPQLALAGMGEAFHFPGNNAFLYQEFPLALKSTATAMVAMMIAIAFYLSTAVVGIVQKVTNWLPDNINEGRMDKVYWVCFGLGGVNFVYYLGCAWFYKYQGLAKVADENKA